MLTEFAPQEVLSIAIKVEENGVKFYNSLEQKAKDKDTKGVFKYLKEQEEDHKKTFQKMLKNLGDYIVYDFSPGEYDNYLKAITAEYVFTEQLMEENLARDFPSDLEAVEFGIYVEKESILVYSALREYAKTEKKEVFDKIVDEEKQHLIKLSVLKGEIRDRVES